jgi:hypothetical protein
MTKKVKTPDTELALDLLNSLWQIIQENSIEIDPHIDKLVNSNAVSIRFCLPTQLLGKLTSPKLNCLCLQKGSGDDDSLWDPRSFSNKIIVPWVAENQNVLGSSTDPYVGKPLRKPRLEINPLNVKYKEEWISLFNILNEVEEKNLEDFTRLRLLQTLKSIHNKLTDVKFEYYMPERISLDDTIKIVSEFLSESSGGDRGLSVAAAIFETFKEYFGIYKEIKRNVINASDQSTGLAGDIECVGDNGQIKLAIEVKERIITLTDVRSALFKARKVSLKELLFNSPGISTSEENDISDLILKTWASGTNLYHLSIAELIKVGLSLTGEAGRRTFLENVGKQLDTYNTQPINRKRWKELLEKL